MIQPLISAALVGYLLGALPFGYLVAKAKGVNIFEVGSKSPGATNVRRVLGRGPGNLVLLLDALKGAAAAFAPWGYRLLTKGGGWELSGLDAKDYGLLAIASLAGAIVGHSFSCFTRFQGGKSVATTAGGFLVMNPWVLVIALGVWLAVFRLSRYVSLASILAAFALPVAACLLGGSAELIGLAAVIAIFVTFRHRANIVRLLNGTENKFVKKAAAPEAPRP
jgi:glycerol-3-phosphate acyltransferase PlsY